MLEEVDPGEADDALSNDSVEFSPEIPPCSISQVKNKHSHGKNIF